MIRSKLPPVTGLPRELVNYLDELGRPIPAVSDLSASPTNAEIATAFNALLAALRGRGRMES